MKPMLDARNDRDDADMTVEQVMARLRWLEVQRSAGEPPPAD